MIQNGNSFDSRSFKYGHARKVWREVKDVYPAGGVVSNVSEWVSAGKIPSGTAVKLDMNTKEITAYTDAKIKSEADISTLGINGLLQEDIVVSGAETKGTGTVVYAGEIYEYMFDADVVAKLKTAGLPMIVFVQ